MKSLLTTCAVFFGVCVIYLILMLSQTDNIFTYTVDDAYIHLALAKNFALHKVWGMTQYTFSSSSSSPIFTFILSILIYIFGNHDIIPLIFNLIISFFVIYFLDKYYSQYFQQNRNVIIASLFTLFFAVFHLQVMLGMEHVLQVFLIVVNIYFFQKWLDSDFKKSESAYWFYFTIALLGLVRFESMFYFVSLAFVFVCLKNFRNAFLTLVCGFLPILIFGYFNYQQSGYFLPYSVVVKGARIELAGDFVSQLQHLLLNKLFLNITFYKVGLFFLLITVVLLYRDYRNKISFHQLILNNFLLIVLSFTLILHSFFGTFRAFFRYEAYISVAFVMVIIPRLKHFFVNPLFAFKKDKVMGLLIIFNVLLLVYKFGFSHLMIVNGSRNIYEQQIQSAKFLKKYYNTSKVVANDIGAICYFSDIHLLDIVGLGSKEMIPYNENGREFDQKFENFVTEYSIKNNYDLAIVYEEWFGGYVPKNWKKVAVLTIDDNINAAVDHVVIYSINPENYLQLQENVRKFKWNKNVQVSITGQQ
ncbi:hypothetical protein NZ698_11865 [Chryseobacterium sp. PBS4-4]|uniref:Glycosyltransferase RgtA/B/C/D-like domain-containing protein n=1 Tax=Chryseobacterium edaphi TaxID=2976532 RepID=A0ABT2W7D7_9FLAO|nr:hypothetical protein [Chryseobacterium edaphi]MCU7617895.1 hypothetical protein [Chryseobacterium edaphi]